MVFPYPGEIEELNETVRKQTGGNFVSLPSGITHYQLAGAEDGPTVVMTHGFSVPYFIFDLTFEFLVNSGFRVLRYDLLGRGLSDRPSVNYNSDLFVRQLKELTDVLDLRNFHLMGLSMGGPITASYIQRYPMQVKKYILIDPAGAAAIPLPWYLKALKIPVIGEILLGLFGNASLINSMANDVYDPDSVAVFQERYKMQMRYRGFMRALLSTIRNGMLDSFAETYEAVGQANIPTLIFWGKDDRTVPYNHSQILLEKIPHAELQSIENCGHIPHYEKPHLVNPIVLRFLSG